MGAQGWRRGQGPGAPAQRGSGWRWAEGDLGLGELIQALLPAGGQGTFLAVSGSPAVLGGGGGLRAPLGQSGTVAPAHTGWTRPKAARTPAALTRQTVPGHCPPPWGRPGVSAVRVSLSRVFGQGTEPARSCGFRDLCLKARAWALGHGVQVASARFPHSQRHRQTSGGGET